MRILLTIINAWAFMTYAAIASTPQEIDKRIKSTEMLLSQGKVKEYILANNQIYEDSKTISYSKGVAWSNFALAMALNRQGKLEESIKHLRLAETEEYSDTSMLIKSNIYRIYGDNNYSLGLYENAIKQYKRVLHLNLDEKDNLLGFGMIYNSIALAFNSLNKQDSSYYYYTKAYSILLKAKSTKELILQSATAGNIGEILSKRRQLDSAFFYLKQSLDISNQTKNAWVIMTAEGKLGQFYLSIKSADSAIMHLKKALFLAESAKDIYQLKRMYGSLGRAYQLTKETDQSNHYLNLYAKITDSITTLEKQNLQAVVKANEEDDKKKFVESKKGLVIIIAIISLSLIIISFIALKKTKEYKQEKKMHKLDKAEFEESLKDLRSQAELDSLSLLQELAAKKDISFFVKFNELYPKFREQMLLKFPNISVADLEFCSYLRLNFDTKKIARYANMTVRSVEAKKYRLRKKFGIHSAEDINIWIINKSKL